MKFKFGEGEGEERERERENKKSGCQKAQHRREFATRESGIGHRESGIMLDFRDRVLDGGC